MFKSWIMKAAIDPKNNLVLIAETPEEELALYNWSDEHSGKVYAPASTTELAMIKFDSIKIAITRCTP